MRKILIITNTLSYGGVENLVLNTAKHLSQKGYLPAICNLSGTGELMEEARKSGILHYSPKIQNFRIPSWRGLIEIRKIISDFRPDIIHTHQFASDLYGSAAALFLKIPVICQLHNPELESWSRRYARFFWIRWLVRAFIATTETGRKKVGRALFGKKIFLLHNAIEIPPAASRNILNLPSNSGIIAGIGRLTSEKGFDILISSFKLLLSSHPNSFLVIVGDGPEKPNLQKLAEQLRVSDRVLFAGYQQQAASLLPNFNVVAISSRSESFSLVALESLAAGIPVILSENVQSKDLFAGAALVSPATPEGFRNCLVDVFDHQEKSLQMAAVGQKLIRSEFTMEKYADRLESIYNSILKNNS